jgi:uncharacterized protein
MKKTIFLLLCLVHIYAMAQPQQDAGTRLFRDGMAYLNGITKTYNPETAKQLFYQSAALGNGNAMNALGNLYTKGVATTINMDSALKWYTAAGTKGYAKAWYNAGTLYKFGTGVSQNFAKAVSYFAKGNTLGDRDCKTSLAYMYYKGFGVQQNYSTAFSLYKEAATTGNANAMYFLGLCYRNGYGTAVNSEEAKKWLQKAANKHEGQAAHELNEEPEPENISTISPYLQNKLEWLKKYNEKYRAETENNYEGEYTGYVIYYDWSGKYVSEIQTLTLALQKIGNQYKGVWKEGEDNKAAISLTISGGQFSFDEGSSYKRINHYSGRKPEQWQFNKAQLKLGFADDSIQLTGFVQFYSPGRKEPGKPLQIFLKKATDISSMKLAGISKMALFPNPAQGQTTLQFTLSQPARTSVQITSQTGAIVYKEAEKLLPAGTYNYAIPLGNLAAAVYNISIAINGKIAATKLLIKQ